MKPPCARIDLFKQHVGLDLTKMYPAGGAAGQSAGRQVDLGHLPDRRREVLQGRLSRSGWGWGRPPIRWTGSARCSPPTARSWSTPRATSRSSPDATKQVLEYAKRLVKVLPPDVFAWDDASNNKWLISGKGALIMNPPSAWAVAKRDNPKVAEQFWTFPSPQGPEGALSARTALLLGHLEILEEQGGREEPHRAPVAALRRRTAGRSERRLRHPGFSGLRDFKIWAEEGPPKGTLYNYPPRDDQIVSISAVRRHRRRSPTRSTPRRPSPR